MSNYGNPEHNPWNSSIISHIPGGFDSEMAPPLSEGIKETNAHKSFSSSDSTTVSFYSEIYQSREWEDTPSGSADISMTDPHVSPVMQGPLFNNSIANGNSSSNMGHSPSPSHLTASGMSGTTKNGRTAEGDSPGKPSAKRQQLLTPTKFRLDQANAQIGYQTALIRDKVAKNKVQAAKIHFLEEQLAGYGAAERHSRRLGKQRAVSIETDHGEEDDSADLDAQEALEVENVLRESREAFQKAEQQAEILALRGKIQRYTLATSSSLPPSRIPVAASSSSSTPKQLSVAPPMVTNLFDDEEHKQQDIPSIKAPQCKSFFITPTQRRARNATQDNLVCPRRKVGIPRLPFVTPGSENSTNLPKIKTTSEILMEIEEQTRDLNLNRPQDIRILVDMLHRVLEGLGDDGQRIRSGVNTRLKEGSLKHLEHKKKEEQSRIGPVDDKKWKQSIREIFKQFYRVAFANDFMSYQSADPFLVSQYEKGIGDGPDASLPLSLSPGDINSRWNRKVITRFIEALSTLRNETPHRWYLPDVSDLYLRALFLNQVREAQKAWSSAQPKTRYWQDGALREETMEEVKERIHEARPIRLKTVSARAFRARKFQRRLETAKEYAKQHGDIGLVWKKLVEILELLGVDGQSDEEEAVRYTTSGKRVYVIEILLCSWRAADITRYMMLIDEVYEQGKAFTSNKRGSKGQTRERVQRESKRDATPKLPSSFYDSVWLETQDDWYIEDVLRISPADFQLLEPLLQQTDFSSRV
ncbi:hypothetical protein F5051DRAFT_432843 [Lentinula edodes]|nr:hypothetical protein F5051DRAFT_432843 [Lentinula edodes]